MLTPRQFAAEKDVSYTTVMGWLQQGLIEGAIKTETPFGHYWEVPASAIQTFTPPQKGRPKKSKPGLKSGSKKRKDA